MTSQGTAHGRFQRAIQRGRLFHAELAAREFGVSRARAHQLVAAHLAAAAAEQSTIEETEAALRLRYPTRLTTEPQTRASDHASRGLLELRSLAGKRGQ